MSNPSYNSAGHLKLSLPPSKLLDLLHALAGPDEGFSPEVHAVLVDLADDFVENVANFACGLAKHRKSNTLEIKDIQIPLERHYNLRIPAAPAAEENFQPRIPKRPTVNETFRKKLAMVNKIKSQQKQQEEKEQSVEHVKAEAKTEIERNE